MDCQTASEHLGAFVDNESPPDLREALASHLDECERCIGEVEALRQLATRLATPVETSPPPELWESIADRLDSAEHAKDGKRRLFPIFSRPIALAASVAVLLGLGLLASSLLGPDSSSAHAATLDFSQLLDGLSTDVAADVAAAVDKFLAQHQAKPITPTDVPSLAPELSFAVPHELPGGFQLQQTYQLRFKNKRGIAARYARGDELLMTLVHPPVGKEDFGTHRGVPCIIGDRHGHQVEVGPWRLIHLTEPTTCHCVLSKLDLDTELPAVLDAISPNVHPGADPIR